MPTPIMSDKLAEKCQEVMSLLLAEHHPHVKLLITSHNAELVEGCHGLVNKDDDDPEDNSDFGNGLNEDDMMFGVTTGD